MEISSAISKLQAATVTTKALNAQHVQNTKSSEKVANTKETVVTPKKNQEINDKCDISKKALELLKNEYGAKNTVKKDSANKTDLTAIANKTKHYSAKTCAYQKALKSYNVKV